MRDLYTRLNVNKSASVSELERAIESCWDAKLKKDAAMVLLNPQMREAYDQAHNVLCNIGNLRSNLGLNNSSNWTGTFAADFSFPPSSTPSQLEVFRNKIKRSNVAGSASDDSDEGFAIPVLNFLKQHPLLTIIVVLVGVAFLWSVFNQHFANDESKPFNTVLQQSRAPQDNDRVSETNLPWIEARQRATAERAKGAFDDLIPESNNFRFTPAESQLNAKTAKPLQLAFLEPEITRPQSGAIQNFSAASRVAPFEIKASQLGNYLVKLVYAHSRHDVMTIFVRGGTTVEVEVPLGVFEVRYAYGEKWYGYNHLFGPDTVYSKAETTFDFSSDGNRVTGYTITLYGVRDGNLQTSKISAEEF